MYIYTAQVSTSKQLYISTYIRMCIYYNVSHIIVCIGNEAFRYNYTSVKYLNCYTTNLIMNYTSRVADVVMYDTSADLPDPLQAVRDKDELQDEDEKARDKEHPGSLERPPGPHQSRRPPPVLSCLRPHQSLRGGETCSFVRN